jgi:uncharacterized BrkB/YihY/UPF0761 family membrane protein
MGYAYFGVFLLILFLIGLAARFLSTQLHRHLVLAGNRNARGYRIAAFIVSFLLIFVGLAIVFLLNVRIER